MHALARTRHWWPVAAALGWAASRRAARARAVRAAAAGTAPVPRRRPHKVLFGDVRGEDRGPGDLIAPPREEEDDLFWLRDDARRDPEVLAHLRAENAYTAAKTAHLEGLREDLYKEQLSRVQETEATAAAPSGGWDYYERAAEGKSYRAVFRRPRAVPRGVDEDPPPHVPPQPGDEPGEEAGEEVVLDVNVLGEGKPYMDCGVVRPSPSHGLLAYCFDATGNEEYEVRIRDLGTGKDLPDRIQKTTGCLLWGADDSCVYYLTMDETRRPANLYRHTLGDDSSRDELLHVSEDKKFWGWLEKTSSGRFLVFHTESKETSELWALDLSEPGARPFCVQPAEHGMRYSIQHRGEHLYIATNAFGALDFQVMVAPVSAPGKENWEPLPGPFKYDPSRTVDDIHVFERFIAVEGRQGGLSRVWTLALEGDGPGVRDYREVDVAPGEPGFVYTSRCGHHLGGANKDFGSTTLLVGYSSMTRPDGTYACDMRTGAVKLVKQRAVPGYERSAYAAEQHMVEARDGTEVPVSLVYRRDLRPVGGGLPPPCHLYAYGSYGMCSEPRFDPKRLPLLDRGFVWVVAHVRGGAEMGRAWYEEQGKYLAKKNTFNDFVDVARWLVGTGRASPSRLSIAGRSAGGLVVGNAVSAAPELFRCALGGVPFTDLMVTMCDPSIPLTTEEWEEWGNPNAEKFFDYMRGYCPMTLAREGRRAYPDVLATGGLHDPRVAYWEPAKWVARLRAGNTAGSTIALKMDMDYGHFSASDRYRALREWAFELAFLLNSLGLQAQDNVPYPSSAKGKE